VDAETYLRVLAETRLRHFRAPGATSWDGVRELRYVGAGLAALGLLDAGLAEAIADELDAEVQVRMRRSGQGAVHSAFGVRSTAPARPSASPEPPPAAVPPPDPPRPWPVLTPAGQAVSLDDAPGPPCLRLLALARTPDSTVITVAGRLGPRWTGTRFYNASRELTAVDDAGSSFTVQHSGNSWDGLLTLAPGLPPGATWVEIFRRPDGPRTRVDLNVAPTPAQTVTEPLPPARPAERLLDAIAGDMLAQLPGAPHHHAGLGLLVAALEETGLLPPGDPAAGRLAVLCQRIAFSGGQALVDALTDGRLAAAELPAPWASVLGYFQDGKRRPDPSLASAPVAVTLPEVDGVQFAVTGLNTDAEHTGLEVLARGRTPRRVAGLPDVLDLVPWFPWWARDSTGQWHVTTDAGSWSGGGLTRNTLRMVPPVSPAATSLELTTAGPATEVRVTVPLTWQEDA
jgi:hypothetical protein